MTRRAEAIAMTLGIRPEVTDPVPDAALARLLHEAFVSPGHMDPEVAATLLAPDAVRQRGDLLCAKDPVTGELVGMVIVVGHDSPARRIATAEEAELHLLAVLSSHRGKGLGGALIRAAMHRAALDGYRRMVLWSQPTMLAAHSLYTKAGFVRAPVRDWQRGERHYWVFEASLEASDSLPASRDVL